jgi:PKD repeat protein
MPPRGRPALRYLWTFGDGTNRTIQHPIHISTSAGNYTISLNVTNRDGANATIKENYISVFNPPRTTIPTITGLVKLLEIQHGEKRLKNLMVY